MTDPDAALARSVAEGLADARQANVGRLGPMALAWLALPPLWTDDLAIAASFPAPPEAPLDREIFLVECEKIGWCVRRPASGQQAEAAEILIDLVDALTALGASDESDEPMAPLGDLQDRAVVAALQVVNQIPAYATRLSMRERLVSLLAPDGIRIAVADPVSADLTPVGPGESLPVRADPAEVADLLMARGEGEEELHELLASVPLTELQRAMLRPVRGLPVRALEAAVLRLAAEATPRVASRVLAAAAPNLPAASISGLIALVLSGITRQERGAEGAVANLAIAASYGDDSDLALNLCERLSDDQLRARALAVLAGAEAERRDSRRTDDVVNRIARVIVSGEGVDLTSAADAVARLANAGAISAAAPIVRVASHRLSHSHLAAPDVGALARLAITLREAGQDAPPESAVFARTAIGVARQLGDPTSRAASLARVVPLADASDREALLSEALSAAAKVADADNRARALIRLIRHFQPSRRHSDLGQLVTEVLASIQPTDPGSAFWVPEGVRPDIIAGLEQERGLPWLRSTAAAVAKAVLSGSQTALVPAALRRWAVLAETLDSQHEAGDKTGDALLKEVEPLLRSGHTAEALGWIETGRRLLGIISGTFDTSLLVAARRVELVQRTADDRRMLQRFLVRNDQVETFREILRTPDGSEPWALHYLGAGGVGKTMLLRHIAAELAPVGHFIIARVDFDHLNPEFPVQRPGQLLLDILEELEAYADGETRGLYEEARTVLRYQEWWRDDAPDGEPAGRVTSTIDHAIGCFCAYLMALGNRIILILDTCEELARFQPSGAILPQLDAAFRLLERVHAQVPSVRVIFAGRRPLARRLHGGIAVTEQWSLAGLPAEKTYLRVQEIAGFTEAEARDYLLEMEGLTLDDETLRDLLERSQGTYQQPFYSAEDASGDVRLVPFDLAQYAAQLRDDPEHLRNAPPSRTVVTYVRDRIVARQGPLMTQLLPAVVAMHRFDRAMLAVAVRDTGAPWEEAWQELTTTEWITAHVDTTLETTFLGVDRTLLERLAAYYQAADQRGAYDEARLQLGEGLAELVRRRSPRMLAIEHVDGALRCLTPTAGAALCDDLTIRVAADGAWIWAYNVFSRVLGLDGALADPAHQAAASARALYATALAQVKPAEDLRSQWRGIVECARRHPDPGISRWLMTRAQVLAEPQHVSFWWDAMGLAAEMRAGDETNRRYAAWLIGAILSAANRTLDEAAARHAESAGPDVASWSAVLAEVRSSERGTHVSAAAALLIARGHALTGNSSGSTDFFATALRAAEQAQAFPPMPEAEADGAVPRNLRDRVRLEAFWSGFPDARPGEWLSEAVDAIRGRADVGQSADPDSDRLAAVLLNRRLDEKLVPAKELDLIQQAIGIRPPPPARTLIHRLVPPLRVALSRGWLALGDARRARAVLGPRGEFADPAEQLLLDLARVDIARRLRLPESDAAVRRVLRDSCPALTAPRLYEAMALLGDTAPGAAPPELAGPPERLHAWWRTEARPLPPAAAESDPGRSPRAERLAQAFRIGPSWSPADQPQLRDALQLDLAELEQLVGSTARGRADALLRLPLANWASRFPDRHEDAWRLALRRAALLAHQASDLIPGQLQPEMDEIDLPGVSRPGPRRAAELALEEGELLALRLPEPAAYLLHGAARLFAVAGDPVGALIAHVAYRLVIRDTGLTRPDLGELEASYQAASQVVHLPDWTSLREDAAYAAAVAAMPKLSRAGCRSWEGWLEPLRALLREPLPTRRAHGTRTTPATTALAVRPITDPAGIPPARIGGPVVPGWVAAVTAVRAAALEAGRRRRHRMVLTVVAAVVSLVAAIISVLGYGAFADAVAGLPVLHVAAVRILAYLAVLIGAVRTGALIFGSGPRNNWAAVWIRPGPVPESAWVELMAERGRRWPLRPRRRYCQDTVRLQNGAPADQMPGSVHEQLRAAAGSGWSLRVSLHVAPSLVGIAWESWIGGSLSGPDLDLDLDLERRYPSRPSDPVDPRAPHERYRVLAPPRWRSLVGGALSPGRVEFATAVPAAVSGDVLIVVAIAVDMPTGRHLVVHSGQSRHQDLVIDPDDASVADATIVVVGEPRGESAARSLRYSAVALRTCAADLMAAGARTVIVVPNVPAVVASDVLTSLASTLRPGESLSEGELSAGVSRARRVLGQETDPPFGYELTLMSRALL